MADIVSSLFGLTPREAEQQATQQNFELGALIGAASINPYDTAIKQDAEIKRQAALAALGGQAVRRVAGLFGVQDERLKRATTIESILQSTQQELGENVNNPAVLYPTLQKKLADAGFSREAMQVGQVGQKAIQDVTLSQAKLATEQAQLARAKQEKIEKRFIPVGKNVWDNDKQVWVTPPVSEEDKSNDQSSDKRYTELNRIYNDTTKSIAERNKAAIEANTLIPISYKGTGNVPQLALLEESGQDSGVAMSFSQGATPSDTVASITTPNATIKASPSITYKPLPGSKAAQEIDEKQVKEIDAVTTAIESLSGVMDSVQKALPLVNKNTTGWNAYGKFLAGSPAQTLDTYIKNIKSNASLETIRQMKAQSKTGATGFGALNLKELETIESSIAVLNQTNDENVVRSELEKINKIFLNMQNRSKEIYKKTTGQSWIPQDRRVAFSFPPNMQLNPQQEAQVAKAIKAVELGKVKREQAYEMLKKSPYFRDVEIQLGIGGY